MYDFEKKEGLIFLFMDKINKEKNDTQEAIMRTEAR